VKPILYLGCPGTERADAGAALASADLAVVWADSAAQAAAELKRRDLPVLLDLARGDAAIKSVRELRAERAGALIFAVVDLLRPDLTIAMVASGVADVFSRPLAGRRIAHAIERERLDGGRPRRVAVGDDLYCQSPGMRDVAALVTRAATMRAGVVVKGEEGTGRQVVARAIHAADPNAAGSFVVVDCAAHAGGELERVLFGSTRAPEAADASGFERVSQGSALRAAHRGTLYMKHLAEAPTRVQARLARVLRDREAHLVEAGRPVPIDVRPIAGIDRGIEVAVEDGRVLDDLFRRLSVIPIELPPLRGRREDIPVLANCFVREICGDRGIPPKMLSRAALSLVSALPWRGNASELRSVLEAAVARVDGARSITLDDVLAQVRLDSGVVGFAAAGTLRQARARFEREYIVAVIERHHGRISDAAKALGIQRTNLYRKLRTLQIVRDRR
jgi:two-component system nitrogen regulation response regulator NtrX